MESGCKICDTYVLKAGSGCIHKKEEVRCFGDVAALAKSSFNEGASL